MPKERMKKKMKDKCTFVRKKVMHLTGAEMYTTVKVRRATYDRIKLLQRETGLPLLDVMDQLFVYALQNTVLVSADGTETPGNYLACGIAAGTETPGNYLACGIAAEQCPMLTGCDAEE